jgi:hypothetical protein
MVIPESELKNLHPLALQTARMFATGYCRNERLSEDDAQTLANDLAGMLHVLLIRIEEVVDFASDQYEDPYDSKLFKDFAKIFKNYLRTGMSADWDDSDGPGDDPVSIAPEPVLSGTV